MNDIKLQESHPLDKHLRPIKVDDEVSALEISTEDVRVKNLKVSGTTTGVSASDDTKLPLAGNITYPDGFTLDCTGDINLTATNDINVPADVGITFGDDGEKIEGTGLDLNINSSRHFTLDVGGLITLDSGTGTFV